MHNVLAYSFLKDNVTSFVFYLETSMYMCLWSVCLFFKTVNEASLMKSANLKHKLENLEDRGERILNSFCRVRQKKIHQIWGAVLLFRLHQINIVVREKH